MKMSFVIPCYRSENTVMTVVKEIEDTMSERPEYDYEIILVNDGSPDNVWKVIDDNAKNDRHIIGINLSKNFGQHCALMAGYNNSKGDYIVSLDDDGQTPVCDVFKLVDEFGKGYDIVYASYPEEHKSIFRKWGSDLAKVVSDYVFDVKNDDRKATSFFVCKRFIIEEIIKYTRPYPYLMGLVLRTTRNIGMVPLEHRDRISGKSGYNLKGLIKHMLNGFTAFSVKPLELGAYLGFLTSLIGFIYAIYIILRRIFVSTVMAGWSSLFALVLIVSGIIMIMLGLIGEYIGRIYICINNSPQYVIKDICSYNDDK